VAPDTRPHVNQCTPLLHTKNGFHLHSITGARFGQPQHFWSLKLKSLTHVHEQPIGRSPLKGDLEFEFWISLKRRSDLLVVLGRTDTTLISVTRNFVLGRTVRWCYNFSVLRYKASSFVLQITNINRVEEGLVTAHPPYSI